MSHKLEQPEDTRWYADRAVIHGTEVVYSEVERVAYRCEYRREMRVRPGRPATARSLIALDDLRLEREVTIPSKVAKRYEDELPPAANELVEEFTAYIRLINRRIAPHVLRKLKDRLRHDGSVTIAGLTLNRNATCAYRDKTYDTADLSTVEANGVLVVRAKGRSLALCKLSTAEDNVCFLAEMIEFASKVV